MSEDDRVTEMGKPRLGDISMIEVVITESEQFRVSSIAGRGCVLAFTPVTSY